MTTGTGRAERRHIVIHAHFYQPPREDPAFDEIEAEPSAAPYHDWNERIERECYRAVVAARVHGADGRIVGIVNTLEWISFNVGPTLFEWMARHAPDTARRIVEADQASERRLGHGNAIAHPYHHVILPLASRRDKRTEVRWGIRDFRRRFGREPDGMWLPETAVDDETLDVLAEEGIRFTILAPHQVVGAPANGHAGRYVTSQGREIALFPYHGEISHGIAFGGLVRNADTWLDALWDVKASRRRSGAHEAVGDGPPHPLLVSAATDGETYGHHHKFAELALARVLERSRTKGGHLDNFASFLAQHPAHHDVTITAPSSWSCAHGIERWRSDCGCRMDAQAAPSQAWRAPLRTGLAALGEALATQFEEEGKRWFAGDPWAVRDAYGEVVGTTDWLSRSTWLKAQLAADVPDPAQAHTRPFELLEMARDGLRMFTSCAWFFDDIGGIEPRQVLRYAARAIALSRDRTAREPALVETLASARSNDATVGSGDRVYARVLPANEASVRYAAGIAMLSELAVLEIEPMFGAPVDVDLVSAFEATVAGGHIQVLDRRTLAGHTFRVTVRDGSTGNPSCDVVPVGANGAPTGELLAIALGEVPEFLRRRVRRAMLERLIIRSLTLHEQESLSAGRETLPAVAARALFRAVRKFSASGFIDEARADVDAALDLFEQTEKDIPFDVQTAFWDGWSALPVARRAALRPLARRLGFDGD